MTRAETRVVLATLLAFVAIFLGVAFLVQRRHAGDAETARLRQVYLAVSLYQADESNRMPPNLACVRTYLHTDGELRSGKDPWAGFHGPFPVDGALPFSEERIPVRVSDAYAVDFLRAGTLKSFDADDPRTVMLADPWRGEASITGKRSFDAEVSGGVVRIRIDGSVQRAERRTRRLSDANDLFLSPSS